ncbi:hypothetical protein ACLIYP_20225 [Streptomyces nanhaiensis]|uniref:hypothetical protein n=1 Tax=Streptomyces nanhaiensis TaxID=679319 RepID=UPI00399CE0ED
MGKRRKEGREQRGGRTVAEETQEQSKATAERMARTQPAAQGTPADVARKHRRRFGHN